MQFEGRNGEYLELIDLSDTNHQVLNESRPSELSLLWSLSENNSLTVDSERIELGKNELISLTEFHRIKSCSFNQAKLIRWNREFYCIIDHDSEVSCKGILYYGAWELPLLKPDAQHLDILETVLRMLEIEMISSDELQLEMLQMMLKRLLILCTRIYKAQGGAQDLTKERSDIIREYNFLVEQHFREKHSVKEYADLLFKSPKTLSNLFKKLGETTPLQFIQKRIMLEARRLLHYTDRPVSEIGYELGFSDIQVFSRFFKRHEGCSPQHYREHQSQLKH